MFDFKKIGLEDIEIIGEYTKYHTCMDCNWSFVNLSAWGFTTNSMYAFYKGHLIIRFEWGEDYPSYMICLDHDMVKDIVQALEEYSISRNERLSIHGVSPKLEETIESLFPEQFEYIQKREYFDYIYLRDDLVELNGKNYKAKRNHINKFTKTYLYEYKPLTLELLSSCKEVERKWCIKRGCTDDINMTNEHKALSFMLDNFEKLNIMGGTIWVDGEIVAFTLASEINEETIDIHIEKADTDYDGVYSVINQEFASTLPSQYRYINREEDLGMPGLRKSKLSYHPNILLPKCRALKKEV